jgi:hypothetical protein
MTFSATQVRRPPSKEHLDSTSPYATFLSPFDAALSRLCVDNETGMWVERDADAVSDPDQPEPKRGLGGMMRRVLPGGRARDRS